MDESLGESKEWRWDENVLFTAPEKTVGGMYFEILLVDGMALRGVWEADVKSTKIELKNARMMDLIFFEVRSLEISQ